MLLPKTENDIPESYKDNPPSHYYKNSTSGSKNKNTVKIAQGIVKSQEKYRDDVLTVYDIFINSAFQVISSHDEVFALYAFTDTIGVP
uniref:Uncharacterized protein n=1 Tax=Rhizophagus irregularis (strain DAOM 181602 / DAOM 197198 / MUCL 43194) TaxID=747089 RepID=U9TH18_RHIID